MNNMLIPIKECEFKEKVAIKFNNINEGFNKYNNSVIEGTEEAFIQFIKSAYELNGQDYSYVDFYYNVLNEEDKSTLKKLVSAEDRKALEDFEKQYNEKNIYYKLTEESIPIITRLCTKEVLFSTFYFIKYPCTIWGNYNNSFPIFYNTQELYYKYREMAAENNINIR